eukprot:TRINITY_DN17880_c0_g1_i2.p1 TRINITY_DN17880_c0_g1~~TRINITY_DN17880_c0_g1_i2.p1  ORF type:complete len:485 (+),score=51.98 TRINITY_DN17880_c0_g1_i2:116-1570(+)
MRIAVARSLGAATPDGRVDAKLVRKTALVFQQACALALSLIVVCTVIYLQWYAARIQEETLINIPMSVEALEQTVPNFHHLWHSPNPLLVDPLTGRYELCKFGGTIVRNGYGPGDWPKICLLDADGDGMTNGEELGDPCCTWQPGVRAPYRVWNLTHPGTPTQNLTMAQRTEVSPVDCSAEGSEAERELLSREQFLKNYYMRHASDLSTSDELRWLKYPFFAAILLLIGQWSYSHGLLFDFFGVGPPCDAKAPLGRLERAGVLVGAYLWTDGIAGLTHLCFDFCPRWFPVVGAVAKGFQFHHYHPSAWVVVPFWQMMSHSVPLLGLLSCILLGLRPCRRFRMFWVTTFVLCFSTVLTHRWCHIPPEELPAWFRALQSVGFFMSHEHHQAHHQSLVTQFSNLSGVTDFILDWITVNWIPAPRYQHWLSVTVCYFALPIVLGSEAFWASQFMPCRLHSPVVCVDEEQGVVRTTSSLGLLEEAAKLS